MEKQNYTQTPEKEYCILQINGKGTPFIYHTYSNIFDAKKDLFNLVALEQERNRPYYVNNDFYSNEFTPNCSGKYFCIRQRSVSKWENYFEQQEQQKTNNTEKGNVILFANYI